MKYAVFYLFSILDFNSVMIFILSVFSFKLKSHIKEIVSCGIMLPLISVLLNYFGLRSFAPPIQIALMILIFIFVFKQKTLYSAWIVIFGYIFSGLLQAAMVGLLYFNKVIELKEMQPFNMKGYEMIFAVNLILFILSALLKNRYAFEFDENYNGKPVKTKSKLFWSVIFTTIVLSGITGALMLFKLNEITLVLFLISLLIFIILFTIYSNIRNKEEFQI